jgi:hypothetical protein
LSFACVRPAYLALLMTSLDPSDVREISMLYSIYNMTDI